LTFFREPVRPRYAQIHMKTLGLSKSKIDL
jgi:hypothetical protein